MQVRPKKYGTDQRGRAALRMALQRLRQYTSAWRQLNVGPKLEVGAETLRK
jgi:hypothetical protein